jgi:hypothetical protein
LTELLRLDRNNPNVFIGLVLLVVLAVFVLPDRLPSFIPELSPYFFAGIPCSRLPAAKDLAAHQSILGRSAEDPLQLEIAASEIGTNGKLVVRLTISNTSLGTVPIVYQEGNIVVAGADDTTNGFGIIIDPPPSAGSSVRSDRDPASYAEADIRLLGPRQGCVHSAGVTASDTMIADGGTARAWYRMTVSGEHQPQSEGTRQIYPDQGLAILSEDEVFSEEIPVEPRT